MFCSRLAGAALVFGQYFRLKTPRLQRNVSFACREHSIVRGNQVRLICGEYNPTVVTRFARNSALRQVENCQNSVEE